MINKILIQEKQEKEPLKKGQSLVVQGALDNRKQAGMALRKLIGKITSILQNPVDILLLERERDKLDALRDELNDAHDCYYTLLEDPD
jgi:NAD-dependent DNA ligase